MQRGLGTTLAQSMFVDDLELNVKAGRFLGIRAIPFRSFHQLRGGLKGVGFPISPGHLNACPVSRIPAPDWNFVAVSGIPAFPAEQRPFSLVCDTD